MKRSQLCGHGAIEKDEVSRSLEGDRRPGHAAPRRIFRFLPALLPLLVLACARAPARLVPEEAILEERATALKRLATGLSAGPIMNDTEALISVDGELLERLLDAAMPIETIVGKRYAIRLDSARVSLDGGLALVRLDGRATLVGQSKEDSFADATVYGALDHLEFDPDMGVLRGKIRVIAFDAGRVKLFGNEDSGVRHLVLGLSRLRLGAFDELSYSLEIPVQLGRSISLPEVGPEGGVHIPGARIALSLEITEVRAFNGRLWVSAAFSAPPAGGSGASSAGAGEPGGRARGDRKAPPEERRRGSPAPAVHSTSVDLAALDESVSALLAKDPAAIAVRDNSAPILVMLPEALLQSLVMSVASTYLDRVELNLGPETVHETGVIRARTPFGRVKAGTWTLEVIIHRVSGVLRHGTPRVSLAGGGRLEVEIPARIEGGTGSATIDFNWDPSALGSVLCRGFRIRQDVEGIIKPQEHLIRGGLRVTAGERSLGAQPEFSDEKFPIQFDMTAASWDSIHAALQEQDRLFKCGTVMNPEDTVDRLKGLVQGGIRIGLPRTVFRAFELPASLTKSVSIAGRPVALSLRPEEVRTRNRALWYGASVQIERAGTE